MTNNTETQPTPTTYIMGMPQKLAIVAVSSTLTLVGVLTTAAITYQTTKVQDRSVDAEFTRIALSILAEEFDSDKPEYAREFAVKLLERSSGIPLTDEERIAWVKDGNVLGEGWIMNGGVCQPAISLPSGIKNIERSLRILSAYGESTVFVPDTLEQ
ncbi:hypothetical protein [Ruegeria sp.]|uniref:hypothetical protein n=1 Tax=Ruegeria sp. TaxID=1879320 RepID=UPI00231B4B8C|nr:hypothetical protein [Ruegeria sp.]MDA7966225.1 hypothetical protein [Ruegeria sp.]